MKNREHFEFPAFDEVIYDIRILSIFFQRLLKTNSRRLCIIMSRRSSVFMTLIT